MTLYNYTLLDSGNGRKLEQFGSIVLDRPCAQALWEKTQKELWQKADALFEREEGRGWKKKAKIPEAWSIEVEGIIFRIAPTDFGHLGIFPEQQAFWKWLREKAAEEKTQRRAPLKTLNLFAYSGGSTMALAQGGAEVVHLDASKGMVAWARENAQLNGLDKAPIRWIVDDAIKFLKREIRRGSSYDAIVLDPPTFGRGSKAEVFAIEEQIIPLLQLCRSLLSRTPSFILFSCHTPGFSPCVMHHLLKQTIGNQSLYFDGIIDYGEMLIESDQSFALPSGTFARVST